jgi:menaquinol-cytochrome c reductase cytochrome b/c subunit
MAAIDERRAQFQKYKEDVKKRGKPFYPYAMFHDTVMSLVVVAVIIGVTCVWFNTSGEDPNTCGKGDSCLLGPRYAEPADPGTTNFVPRPDWYFYFLFYLLRIFKWPDSVILGTVGVPTIALILLLAFPFLDLRRERRPLRRPVAVVAAILTVISMGTLTYKGATAKESLGAENLALVSTWQKQEGFSGNAQAIAGAKIFAQVGCLNCHTYLGAGTPNLGAPDLSAIGKTSNRGVQGFADFVSDQSKFGYIVMPKFGGQAGLGDENLKRLGTFLELSKGTK